MTIIKSPNTSSLLNLVEILGVKLVTRATVIRYNNETEVMLNRYDDLFQASTHILLLPASLAWYKAASAEDISSLSFS